MKVGILTFLKKGLGFLYGCLIGFSHCRKAVILRTADRQWPRRGVRAYWPGQFDGPGG